MFFMRIAGTDSTTPSTRAGAAARAGVAQRQVPSGDAVRRRNVRHARDRIETSEEPQLYIVEEARQAATSRTSRLDVNTIDGVRIEWPGRLGLVRASNTSPVLVTRCARPRRLSASTRSATLWKARSRVEFLTPDGAFWENQPPAAHRPTSFRARPFFFAASTSGRRGTARRTDHEDCASQGQHAEINPSLRGADTCASVYERPVYVGLTHILCDHRCRKRRGNLT